MMKARFILIILLFLAVLAVLVWLRPKPDLGDTGQNTEFTGPPTGKTGEFQQGDPASNQTVGTTTDGPVSGTSRPALSPDLFQKSIEGKNSEIEFYGQVLDQWSNVVSGVAIKVKARQWRISDANPFAFNGRIISMETTSGIDGRFELRGETGDGFDIEQMQKAGYRLSPRAARGGGPKGGSPDSPVLFRMWKMGTNEALISGEKVFGIIPDKRAYTLDLLRGKKIEGLAEGDLKISISRPGDVTPRDKYNWAFTIEGLNGGLLITDDEFMYLAPEAGYQQAISKQFDPDQPDWTPMVKMHFFLRSRNGQVYGRADVEVHSLYNGKGALMINYAVNPAGSRNLQP